MKQQTPKKKTLEELFEVVAQGARDRDKAISELSVEVKKVTKDYGNVSNNIGQVAEDYFYTGLESRKKINGIKFNIVAQRVRDANNNEWDIVLTNGDTIAVVEVKQKPHISDLTKFVDEQLPQFRASFPIYDKYKLLGGIAGMTITDDFTEKAQNKGLFVLTQNNKHFKVLNSAGFKPKTF